MSFVRLNALHLMTQGVVHLRHYLQARGDVRQPYNEHQRTRIRTRRSGQGVGGGFLVSMPSWSSFLLRLFLKKSQARGGIEFGVDGDIPVDTVKESALAQICPSGQIEGDMSATVTFSTNCILVRTVLPEVPHPPESFNKESELWLAPGAKWASDDNTHHSSRLCDGEDCLGADSTLR